MKKIYVNFKRFDVPKEFGGVNSLYPIEKWSKSIVNDLDGKLDKYKDAEFSFFFPEAHLLNGMSEEPKNIKIGTQSVHRHDVEEGKNFGAFTTSLPAAAAKGLGAKATLIGHCEERNNLKEIISTSNGDLSKVNELLNMSVKSAINRGLDVLFAIGETMEEQENWEEVLETQLEVGLKDVDKSKVTIAYEPVWAIGPGKTPPDREYIQKIGKFIKEKTGLPVVYGGGLKSDNAEMLSSIPEIDGGLIALTRFSGDIGFYPEEFLEIVDLYLGEEK